MAELDGAQNVGFRDLLRAGFHHHDAAVGARHHDVQLRFAAFAVSRVGQVPAVLHANANAAEDMLERNIGNGQRGTGAADGQGVGILFGIGREHHADDLGLIQETFGEQGR